MIFPVWSFPPLHPPHLRGAYRAIFFRETKDKVTPAQTIKRIKVFRHIAANFTECGQI
jgi:hypothetical protein